MAGDQMDLFGHGQLYGGSLNVLLEDFRRVTAKESWVVLKLVTQRYWIKLLVSGVVKLAT